MLMHGLERPGQPRGIVEAREHLEHFLGEVGDASAGEFCGNSEARFGEARLAHLVSHWPVTLLHVTRSTRSWGNAWLVDIAAGAQGLRKRIEATRVAMRQGIDIIYQATLRVDKLISHADFLRRVRGCSVFGDHPYEVIDRRFTLRDDHARVEPSERCGRI